MKTLWPLFFQGIAQGLLAFLMPCIYPLLPLTIGFFTKTSSTRLGAITKAIIYGLSIIVIYCSLGLLITFIFGPSALNGIASSAAFNLIIFILLIVFAISLFGAFEINLPSGLVNKIDGLSGGQTWLGIFFMALTLTLVSFSCTGYLIGNLIASAAVSGQYYSLFIGMLGFSAALALPFVLAAIFPTFIKTLPKSGSWLNSVKVVLGFIELAASLKFLSNFDLTYHIGILNREVYLSLVIAIFTLMGLYLLGKIKFSHDSDLPHLSITRFFIALFTFSFVIYLIPGLFGAPLKSLSGLLPPLASQEFVLGSGNGSAKSSDIDTLPPNRKRPVRINEPKEFHGFYDYQEGLDFARKVKKPILLNFTGNSCVNCRKMEETVWTNETVKNLINQDFILVSLYVDEKINLPEKEQYKSSIDGSRVKTVGDKNSDIESTKFNTNSQPYYVLIDNEEKVLVPPRAFDENIPAFIDFLEKGNQLFHQKVK